MNGFATHRLSARLRRLMNFLEPQGGFEPPASSLQGSCSDQTELLRLGAGGGNRTHVGAHHTRFRLAAYTASATPALVPPAGFEPTTFSLKGCHSTVELRRYGGTGGPRTRDFRFKRPVLYQLSYDSIKLRPSRNSVLWHPRQESNLHLVGRNHPPFPLDYRGILSGPQGHL